MVWFKEEKQAALARAAIMILAIGLLDWWVVGEIPMGFLYLLPMLAVGAALNLWQIGLVAIVCTVMAEIFDDLPWNFRTGLSRDVLYFAAFLGAGLFGAPGRIAAVAAVVGDRQKLG